MKHFIFLLIGFAFVVAICASFFATMDVVGPSKAWTTAQNLNTVEAYSDFLKTEPSERLANLARSRIVELRWAEVEADNTVEAALNFIDNYPDHYRARFARTLVKDLAFEEERLAFEGAWADGSQKAMLDFYEAYDPDGMLLLEARVLLSRHNKIAAIADAREFLDRELADTPDAWVCNAQNNERSDLDRLAKLSAQTEDVRLRVQNAGAVTINRRLHYDMSKVVTEIRALAEQQKRLAADLDERLRSPAIQGGLEMRRHTPLRWQRQLEEESRADVRSKILSELKCEFRTTVKPHELKGYLDAFPDATSAPLARAALERLNGRSFYDLLDDGLISASIAPVQAPGKRGPLQSLRRVEVKLVNRSDTSLTVIVPAGLVVENGLVVGDSKIGPFRPGGTVVSGMRTIGVARLPRESLEALAPGFARLTGDHPLAALLQIMSGRTDVVWHAAVWIILEDRNFEEMHGLRTVRADAFLSSQGERAIDEDVIKHVLDAMVEAGIDVSSYRVCHDGNWPACGQ